jgi:DNA-binding CsgD family transcriptional regulator
MTNSRKIRVLVPQAVDKIHKSIVQELSNGLTVRDISTSFNLNKRTLESHVSDIKKMYGVKTLPHLVALFLRNKIIK